MRLYLDASALVPLFVPEPQHPDVSAFLARYETPFVLSSLVRAEFVSAMGRYVRRGDLDTATADGHVAAFERWRATASRLQAIDDAAIDEARSYVGRYGLGLRTPDALHLVAATAAQATLVTLDGPLLRAATALGIDAVRPG